MAIARFSRRKRSELNSITVAEGYTQDFPAGFVIGWIEMCVQVRRLDLFMDFFLLFSSVCDAIEFQISPSRGELKNVVGLDEENQVIRYTAGANGP